MPSEIYNFPIETDFPLSNNSNDTGVFRENYLAIERNFQTASEEMDAVVVRVDDLEAQTGGFSTSIDQLTTVSNDNVSNITTLQDTLSGVVDAGGDLDNINGEISSLSTQISTVEANYLDKRTNNNLNANVLSNAHLENISQSVLVNTNEVIDVTAGHYVVRTLPDQAAVSFSFTGFENEQFREVYLELRGGIQTTEISFDLGNTVLKSSELPENFLISTGETHVLHVWSYDGAVNLFVKYLGSYS